MDKQELQKIAGVLLAYEESKDYNVSKTIKDRAAILERYIKAQESDSLLVQPYHMLLETEYHKKAGYYRIVQIWKNSNCPLEGWTLLTLALTIEEMSKMIYESFRELTEWFRKLLKEYERIQGEPDILGALAILKACRLGLVLPEHYMDLGLKLMGGEKETYGFTPSITEGLRKACYREYEAVNLLWGGLQ